MKVLGLDIATKTGHTLYEGMGKGIAPRVMCGTWDFSAEGDGFVGKSAAIGDALDALLRANAPVAYAAIEMPLRVMPKIQRSDLYGSYKANASTVEIIGFLHAMTGAAISSLHRAGVPFRMVEMATWRQAFVGTTRAPPSVDRKDGSKFLKKIVRAEADRLGLSYGFHVHNNDEADSVGIAWWLKAHVLRFLEEDRILGRAA